MSSVSGVLGKLAIIFFIILMALSLLNLAGEEARAGYVRWNEDGGNPVFAPAGAAWFPCVLYDASRFSGHGQAAYYKMWYGDITGTEWEKVAYSDDGINWSAGSDITGITANGCQAKVVYIPGGFVAPGGTYYYKIWYWIGSMNYSIDDLRTADSVDGVAWVNDQALTQDATYPLISGPAGTDWKRGTYGQVTVLHNPSATNTGDNPFDYAFAMYYDATTGGQEVVGLAYSGDGNHWIRYHTSPYEDAPVFDHGATGDWDSGFASFGTVVMESPGVWHFWYSGGQSAVHDGIGHATSPDGINWTRDPTNPLIHKSDGVAWRDVRTYTPSVLHRPDGFGGHGEGSRFKMWFSGRTNTPSTNYAMGYMSSREPVLSLAKSSLPAGEVRPGDEIAYTLALTNGGEAAATGTRITDAVPEHTSYVAGSTTLNGASVPDAGGTTPLQAGMEVSSPGEPAGEVAPGETATVNFKVKVNQDAPGGTEVTNRALAVCVEDPEGVTATSTNRVSPAVARIALEKSALPPGEVTRGSVITYTLRARNDGGTAATGARITDAVPAYTGYVSHTTTLNGVLVQDVNGTTPLAGGMAVNSPGEAAGIIAPGETATVTFMVQVGNNLLLGASVRNVARAEADGLAPVEASCVNGSSADLPKIWYFAEGSTQPGFDEYILLSNMGDDDMAVTITYITERGTEKDFEHDLPAHSRRTVYVNSEMPGESGVAAIVVPPKAATASILPIRSSMWGLTVYLTMATFPHLSTLAKGQECLP